MLRLKNSLGGLRILWFLRILRFRQCQETETPFNFNTGERRRSSGWTVGTSYSTSEDAQAPLNGAYDRELDHLTE
jgi:hypothetical protein